MIEMTLGEIADVVGGRLVDADPQTRVTGSVEFDSRKVGPGGLFLALPGEHVDGHDFAAAAVRDSGAAAALVTRPVGAASIEVADGFAALAALASSVARRLPDTTVVGVTGSAGKTSTKDLLAHLLAALGPTVAPPGSYNNELGHPYTVLRATPDTRFLVLETSARGVGHIAYLTRIAPPRIGVVLNVGSAHLGEFGSQDAIAQAKGELVEALPAARDGGVAVLNADDALVAAMASRTAARVVRVGRADGADVRAADVTVDDLGRASFTLHTAAGSVPVALRLVGEHHVANALAAAAVALECGAGVADIARLLGTATPASRWRMETSERADGVLVINDAYNANPESMRAALDTLARVGRGRRAAGGRTFAVLGPMAELGAEAGAEHVALGRYAADLGLSRVVAVGAEARAISDAAAARDSWDGTASSVPDAAAALDVLRGELRAADVVLVKASRSASLERVAAAIAEDDRSETQGDGGGAG
jgi:UDP-N-acetylmuramoyl-tripeptide--D-alanyl-D-alanine ligase